MSRALGCAKVFEGSLNLHAPSPVIFPEPARVQLRNEDWLFVPVVLGEQAVGLAARRPPPDALEFIEVFACERLAPRLELRDRDHLTIRLLSGKYLSLAA